MTYLAGVLQLLLTVGVVAFYPPLQAEACVFLPPFNASAPGAIPTVHRTVLHLAVPYLLQSLAITAFVSSTASLCDAGGISESVAYSAETLTEAGPWDALFWFVVGCVHAVAVLAVCAPVDLFAALASVYAMVAALHRICRPTLPETSILQVNSSIVGYAFGLCLAAYTVPAACQNRLAVLFLLAVLDYFLGVGHTWDRAPTMHTVANCRLCWACAVSVCAAAMYGVWHENLLVDS